MGHLVKLLEPPQARNETQIAQANRLRIAFTE